MKYAKKLIKDAFPDIDEDTMEYLEVTVADPGMTLDPAGNALMELIGPFLEAVGGDDDTILELCKKLSSTNLNGKPANGTQQKAKKRPSRDAPPPTASNEPLALIGKTVNIATLAAQKTDSAYTSVLESEETRTSKVDKAKLAKANAKQKEKAEKRELKEAAEMNAAERAKIVERQRLAKEADEEALRMHYATKDAAANTTNKAALSRDIKIENFDLSHYGKVILQNAEVTLAYGRHYGLVGRNGIGKTTLLKAIAHRELPIPPHIRVLHVEQEMASSDISALNAVLSADLERESLKKQEKELLDKQARSSEEETKLIEIYGALEEIEADKAESKAALILNGLGFSSERQIWPTKAFSGGWRMRIALAQALFSKPDLLLLDEPTNMLDLEAVIWLEGYLEQWESTLLLVSHDREFLNTVCTDTLHVHSQKVDTYKGNYDTFEKTKAESLLNQQREYETQMDYRKHLQDFIDKWRYNAKRASLAQSKIKILEKLPVLRPVVLEPHIRLRFKEPEQLTPPILQLQSVSFRYSLDGPLILKDVDFGVRMDSRIGIVGVNGSGKTTLLKLLINSLEPTKGDFRQNPKVKVGYFSQHFLDQLDFNMTPLELMRSRFPGTSQETLRAELSAFGVSGPLAMQTIATLSGGQKSRVAFANLCMMRPHVLILDEPSNHLDMETIDALSEACQAFKGGVVLVSHDQKLLQQSCNELWVADSGTLNHFEGEFADYKKLIISNSEIA
eukprot:CFRG2013T1